MHIRQAEPRDASRIAEILVFSKRINYRPIFQNDAFSFGELQVLPVAQRLLDTPETLARILVYDDGFVKGMIHLEGDEVRELYVDPFFTGMGVGGRLLSYAVRKKAVTHLWVLEKNLRAQAFYARYGFLPGGEWMYEEGTTERLLQLTRTAPAESRLSD